MISLGSLFKRGINYFLREDDQNYHQNSFGESRGRLLIVAAQEEQSGKADLLNIETDEDVLDGLGEEQST